MRLEGLGGTTGDTRGKMGGGDDGVRGAGRKHQEGGYQWDHKGGEGNEGGQEGREECYF